MNNDETPSVIIINAEEAPKPVTTISDITEEQARWKLWELGLVSWKFHEAQLDIYDRIQAASDKIFVVNCSRQIGKSFMLCGYAVEFALQHPGCRIAYLAPTAKQVKKIILPRITEILKDCPPRLKPSYKINDQIYRFKNGSEIHISGTDSERAENLRGQVFHLVICDEAGFMDRLEYVVSSILIPLTTHTRGKIILSSTPPLSNDHPFREFADKAKLNGQYVKKTIHDNKMLTEEEIMMLMKESRGPNSVAWRREYLAEFIVDETKAVIPEATEERLATLTKQVVVLEDLNQLRPGQVAVPPYYDAYTVADLGYTDFTGILFGYWDFLAAKLVIQDEALFNKPNTQKIANVVKEKEVALWKLKPPYMRFCDGDLITISDLNTTHQLQFSVTKKDELENAVNSVRLFIESGKIIIDPRCKNLLSQVHNATWDTARSKFKRTEGQGHYDLLAALVYMVRNIHRQRNPYPPGLGMNIHTMFVPDASMVDKSHENLGKAFNVVNRYIKKDE